MSNHNSSSQPTPFPTELYTPGGVMEKVIEYINQTANRKQPIFAVSAALGLMSVGLGRNYKSYTGVYPNLYMINIGATGCGKENPRKASKNILIKANKLNHLGGDRVASAPAIVAKLEEQPNTLYLLDEIGLWLQGISSSKAATYIKEINGVLLTLFTSSDSTYGGTDYADRIKRPNSVIHNPSLSLLGTTTPETFIESLKTKDTASGLLGRFLCFESTDIRPKLNVGSKPVVIDDEIIEWIDEAMSPPTNNHQATGGDAVTVGCSPDAEIKFQEFIKKEEDIAQSNASTVTKDLWVRAFELVSKVSMIKACSRDIKNPEVTLNDAEYAISLVEWCIEENCKRVEENVSENHLDKKIKRLEMSIRNVKKSVNKRYIKYASQGMSTHSYLMNALNISGTEFGELIRTAVGMGRIEEDTYLDGDKSVVHYKLT